MAVRYNDNGVFRPVVTDGGREAFKGPNYLKKSVDVNYKQPLLFSNQGKTKNTPETTTNKEGH